MSLQAKKSAIFIFVAGATVVGTMMLFAFGGRQLFSRHQSFLCYFTESVNGLQGGSRVTFRGVPIGLVDSVNARLPTAGNSRVEVVVRLDIDRLQRQLGVVVDLSDPAQLQDQVRGGLRGKLEVDSYISGNMYLDFDYHPEAPPPPPLHEDVGLGVIPTVSSADSDIVKRLQNFTLTLEGINYQAYADSVNSFADTALDWLARNPGARFNQRLVTALQNASKMGGPDWQGFGGPDWKGRLTQMVAKLTALHDAIANYKPQLMHGTGDVIGLSRAAQANLTQLNAKLQSLHDTLGQGGEVRAGLDQSLQNIADQARALRIKAAGLEQDPALVK